jgi:hypothetical protein
MQPNVENGSWKTGGMFEHSGISAHEAREANYMQVPF